MRILQVTPYYLPHTGGIERYVYNLSKHLISAEHDVEIITSNVPEGLPYEIYEGIPVYRHPCRCTLMGNPIVSGISTSLLQLDEHDVIQIHGVYTYSALRTILALPIHHKQKIILTHHGRVVYPGSIKNIFAKVYEHVVVRYILKKIDCAVVLSQSDKEQFISLGMPAEKIQIIPNGIDTSAFLRPSEGELGIFRKKYSLDGKHVVLFLAVVSARKGIFDLIRAFTRVEDPVAHLLVVGDGPDRTSAMKLATELGITDRVTFCGKLPFSELLCAYVVASVYVLPSYFEGMPTTILEALVLGTPVISTRIPGIEDNFSEWVSLVPAGDVDGLAEEIERVLSVGGGEGMWLVRDEIRERYDRERVFVEYETLIVNPDWLYSV